MPLPLPLLPMAEESDPGGTAPEQPPSAPPGATRDPEGTLIGITPPPPSYSCSGSEAPPAGRPADATLAENTDIDPPPGRRAKEQQRRRRQSLWQQDKGSEHDGQMTNEDDVSEADANGATLAVAEEAAVIDVEVLLRQLLILHRTEPERLDELRRRLRQAVRRRSTPASDTPELNTWTFPASGDEDEEPKRGFAARRGLAPLMVRRLSTATFTSRDSDAATDMLYDRVVSGALPPAGRRGAVLEEIEGVPLQRTQSGVGIDLGKMLDLVEQLKRTKWFEQPVALAFENLRVLSDGDPNDRLPTLARACSAPVRCCFSKKPDPVVRVGRGSGVTGYAQPGEMLLVMGPPGSGCSTLLKTLAGAHQGFQVEFTKFMYNGKRTLAETGSRALYLAEEDVHLPQLTVEETFRFATGLGTPDEWQGVEGMSRKEYNDVMLRTLLPLLGLDHVRDTVVGDDMLRGVSGGEKKRVSIGEVKALQPRLLCLDGWSRGLDSAATFRICKQLRTIASLMQMSVVMSMYQIAPELFQPGCGFKNVLVLDGGRQLYFGPVDRCEAYFTKLGLRRPPRRTVPDFLATLVDISVEQQAGSDAAQLCDFNNKERHSNDIGNKWIESRELLLLRRRLRGTGGHDVLPGSPRRGVTQDTLERAPDFVHRPEFTSIKTQLSWLFWRERRLIWVSKRKTILARYVRLIFTGLLFGLTFWDLPRNRSGAYTRQGALWTLVVNITLTSLGSIPDMMEQRAVFVKQRGYGMLRPWVWYFGKLALDMPFCLLDVFFLGTIMYLLCGFALSASSYFTFIMILWSVHLVGTSASRMCASIAPDAIIGMAMAASYFMSMGFFGGFTIPRKNIPAYWIWAHYISPITYAYRGIMINEYRHLTFECSPGELVSIPLNATHASAVCPVMPTGLSYVESVLDIVDSERSVWGDVGILWGFFAIFIVLNVFAIGAASNAVRGGRMLFKGGRPQPTADAAEQAHGGDGESGGEPYFPKPASPRSTTTAAGRTELRWINVSYSVIDTNATSSKKGEKKRKTLVDSVSGLARPGQMTALMGPSGAGKTTLMDVLALRKDPKGVEGEILMNGAPLDSAAMRSIGYVEQQDLHHPLQTVREALLFSARLRLPQGDVSPEEKVGEVIKLLGLKSIEHAMLGQPGDGGMPLEARKRVTIGVELVTEPRVLFMDEPTSGLDTAGALTVLRCARAVADTGRTIVMTIHQPSTDLFEMFDSVCLLQKGGRLAYFGGIHSPGCSTGSQQLLEYFKNNSPDPFDENYTCSEDRNPADFMLKVLSYAPDHWPSIWHETEAAAALEQAVRSDCTAEKLDAQPEKSIALQAHNVFARTWVMHWRNPSYNITRIYFTIFVALLLGSAGFGVGGGKRTQMDLLIHITTMGYTTTLGLVSVILPLPIVIDARAVVLRETTSATYRRWLYSAALGVTELPYVFFQGLIYSGILYFMSDFQVDADRLTFFYLMFTCFTVFLVSFGQLLGALASSQIVGVTMSTGIYAIWFTFNGFYIRATDLPKWLYVFYVVNPCAVFIRGMVSNIVGGQTFVCDADELVSVPWPEAYAAVCNPARSSVLYGFDSDSGSCQVCPVTYGDDMLSLYGWSYDDRWPDLGRVIGFAAAARIGCHLLLLYKQHVQR